MDLSSVGVKLICPEVFGSSAYGALRAHDRSNGDPSSHHFMPLTETRPDSCNGTAATSGLSLPLRSVRGAGTTRTRTAGSMPESIATLRPGFGSIKVREVTPHCASRLRNLRNRA